MYLFSIVKLIIFIAIFILIAIFSKTKLFHVLLDSRLISLLDLIMPHTSIDILLGRWFSTAGIRPHVIFPSDFPSKN